MSRIKVTNTSIIITNYTMGECSKLEEIFKVYDLITHRFNMVGIYYDEKTKNLYLPAGIDLWKIKNYFNERYYDRINCSNYANMPANIQMKYRPRDDEQMEALKFACGVDSYSENAYLPQLGIYLNTGKGKTYVSIATMAFFKIKSIVITGSNSLLSQWKDNILEYTTLKDSDIIQISGSNMITMILSGKSKKCNEASIYLCSHGTIRSFADQFGWEKINELFIYLGIGLKFYDEAHTNFENMLMIEFFTNIYKTYLVSATPGRSDWKENRVYQLAIKNIPGIDLFDENKDPHTSYVAIKYNSKPSPLDISNCKNKYGLDRIKYIDYITKQPNFYSALRIILDLIIKSKGKALFYIGTNEGILRVYHWISTEYPELLGDIGIFTSLVSQEDKLKEKQKRIILSTTKSAGLGEHIEGLKTTVVLAEPFKSSVIARQTLGRTRDKDTMYIELVDVGFKYTKKYYIDKLETFNKYATDVNDTFIDQYELNKRCQKIKEKRNNGAINPLVFADNRFKFSKEALINHEEKEEIDYIKDSISLSKNPYLK